VAHGVTGIIASVDDPDSWVAALKGLSEDDATAESLRTAARAWVEENFDAHKNAARLCERFAAAKAATVA
jgi:glycosyltransferase involved in cell wall biosynthesis